jgi:hypothetical protein
MDGKNLALEDFAPRAPVRSEVFEFKGKERTWRLLDIRETDWSRSAALKHTYDVLIEEFGEGLKDVVVTLMQGHDAARGDGFKDWTDVYCIAGALCDKNGAPVHRGSPRDAAVFIADAYTPTERAELIRMYLEFVDEHDPGTIDEEEGAGVIERLGKSQDSSESRQYGSNALRSLLLTSAVEVVAGRARIAMLEAELAEYREADALEPRVVALEQVLSAMPRS